MSPLVARLRAQVEADVRLARLQLGRLDDFGETRDEGETARAAIALHHAYGALESALDRCVITLEGARPQGLDSHRALLELVALELPGVRPALVGADTLRMLHELRRFHHFFHHAYGVDLDPERIATLIGAVKRGLPALDGDLERLATFLAALERA